MITVDPTRVADPAPTNEAHTRRRGVRPARALAVWGATFLLAAAVGTAWGALAPSTATRAPVDLPRVPPVPHATTTTTVADTPPAGTPTPVTATTTAPTATTPATTAPTALRTAAQPTPTTTTPSTTTTTAPATTTTAFEGCAPDMTEISPGVCSSGGPISTAPPP